MQRAALSFLCVITIAACAPRARAPWRPLSAAAAQPTETTSAMAALPVQDDPMVETIDGRGGVGAPDPYMVEEEERDSGDLRAVQPEFPMIPSDGRHYIVMQWPLPATGVTSLFGARHDPLAAGGRFNSGNRFHYGVDMQGGYGQVVQASAPGSVIFAGWNRGHGRMVIIQHAGGWRSSYSHLSQLTVNPGNYVRTSQSVGQLGNSGRSTGPHLHFEITRWGAYFDPLDLLGTAVPID